MERLGSILFGSFVLVVSSALAAWFVWRTLKKSEDPGRIVFKWILTAVFFGVLLAVGSLTKRDDPSSAFIVPITGAVIGVVLGILWAPHLGALIAKPFTSFYDGGETEIEERPFYSIARAKQKQGRYPEAIAEVRKQLARFPEDYEGWMLLAEIHADNLKDNLSAQDCINEIVAHGHHAQKNVAFALNRSADWHLRLAADREEARASLQRIVDLFPGTDYANRASQRIAHLTSDKMLAEQRERPRIALVHHEENIGLQGQVADPRPPEETPEAAAARLVAHLADYPLDADAREELAGIYAKHYQRIDLAADQFEELILSPGTSQKQIARWLNMLADWHILLRSERAAIVEVLHRIVELFPGTAVAANAKSRIAYLENELRKNKTSQAVKLGSYEGNIGLKGFVPKRGGDFISE